MRATKLGAVLCLLSMVTGCDKITSGSQDESESKAEKPWAEKAFEDVEKNAGFAKKACEEAFSSCKLEGSSEEGKKERSITLEAVLDSSTVSDFGFDESKLSLAIWVKKHSSATKATEKRKGPKEDGCVVARAVIGEPYTVSASCAGDTARVCCDTKFKEKLDLVLLQLAPLY